MIYKAYVKQEGDGCDFTIGCGLAVVELDAENLEDAQKKLTNEIKETFHGNQKLEFAQIFEIAQVIDLNLEKVYQELKEEQEKEKQRKKEELEHKQFLYLQKKFGC